MFNPLYKYRSRIRCLIVLIASIIGLCLGLGAPWNTKIPTQHPHWWFPNFGSLSVQAMQVQTATYKIYLPIIRGWHLTGNYPIVFVSQRSPPTGSIYWNVPKDMPGVGPYSRFRVAAPGKLMVREPNGALRILIDGSNPTPASLNLSDVNAPDVSYDGTKLIFAGLPSGS